VISSGGASDGIEDHTQDALKDIGANCLVWQLAMKPGKPMAVGMINNKLIFCLPGNPVAAFVCSKLLIKPLIIKLAGGTDLEPFGVMLPCGFEHKKRTGRAEYLRAKIVNKENKSEIILHGRKGAGVISSLTGADGLVEIPIYAEEISKGDYLKFYPFNDISL
jgi:molybdopterin molybdotransferase